MIHYENANPVTGTTLSFIFIHFNWLRFCVEGLIRGSKNRKTTKGSDGFIFISIIRIYALSLARVLWGGGLISVVKNRKTQ